MAIQAETYFSVMNGADEVDKIGLSDTLDNYTAEDIRSYVLCGCRDKLLGGNLGLYNYGGGSYDVWQTGTPFATGTVDTTYMHMFDGSGDNSTADLQGRYCGTVLLTDSLSAFPLCVKSDNIANFKLITELDIKNYCMNISATLTQKGGIGATALSDKTNTLYCVDVNAAALSYRYGTPPVEIAVNLAVVPYHVFDIAGELFLVNGYKTNKLGFSCHLAPNRNAGMEIYPISSSADADSYSIAFNNLGFGDDYSDYSENTYAWAYGFDAVNKYGSTDADLWYQCYFGILTFDVRYYYKTYDQMMMQFANTGLLFKVDGVIYKPLIADNVVYGYTDNLDAESDIDNWERDTKHDIPPTPPTPPTPPVSDDDDIDELAFGSYSGGAGAFANVWYTTATELGNLKTWMNKAPNDGGPPSGYNPMDSILSLMIYPIAIPTSGSLVHISFYNVNDADNHLISSDAQGYYTEGKTFEIDLGSYTIDPHHDQDWAYLDYDTAIELYVPFCGIYQIDTQVVMGTTLNAKMWVDPVMGSCTFCAYANNIPVAMGSGSLGVSLPVSSSQFSMVQAAITTNRNSFLASAIGTAIGAIASVVAGGMSGSAAAVTKSYGSLQMARGAASRAELSSRVHDIARAGFGEGVRSNLSGALGAGANAGLIGKATGSIYNTYRANKMLAAGNSTAVSGGFGGSQDPWRLPMTPYVKILRERTHVSDMHVSTTGKLHVMGATLNECSGFTTVINPDLSSLTDILTQSELAEIYTTLTSGVYC